MAGGYLSPARIRTLIVIDVCLYHKGLAATLLHHPRLTIAVTAGSRADALAAVRRDTPDVVTIDVALAGSLALMRELRAEAPTTCIVAFAVDENISAILGSTDSYSPRRWSLGTGHLSA
jgi:DNA-binding NarL/FixJ family response regulator